MFGRNPPPPAPATPARRFGSTAALAPLSVTWLDAFLAILSRLWSIVVSAAVSTDLALRATPAPVLIVIVLLLVALGYQLWGPGAGRAGHGGRLLSTATRGRKPSRRRGGGGSPPPTPGQPCEISPISQIDLDRLTAATQAAEKHYEAMLKHGDAITKFATKMDRDMSFFPPISDSAQRAGGRHQHRSPSPEGRGGGGGRGRGNGRGGGRGGGGGRGNRRRL